MPDIPDLSLERFLHCIENGNSFERLCLRRCIRKNDGETAPAFSYPRRMRDCNVDDDAGPGSGRDVS